MKNRCLWVTKDKIYQDYHDNEWGVPVYDDHKLFECFLLETFQAGLSWLTILKKRENFRKAFDDFDCNVISNYGDNKVNELLTNEGIIRHRLKIESTIINAKLFIEIQKQYGSFSTYIWNYVDGEPIINSFSVNDNLPSKTDLSDKISKDLKKRGFKFVGSTTMYAFMQAIGLVNDHTDNCFKYIGK